MSWFSNRSIATKIALCFACVIAIGVAAGTFTFLSLSRVQAAGDWMIHSYKIGQTLEEIRADILGQESDVRGYLLRHDSDLLERAAADQTELLAAVARLEDLTRRSGAQRARLASLSALLALWRSQLPNGSAAQPTGIGAEGVLERILDRLREINAGSASFSPRAPRRGSTRSPWAIAGRSSGRSSLSSSR